MLLLMLGLLTTSGGALGDFQSPRFQCEMLWHAELVEGMLQLVAWPLLHITAGQLCTPDSGMSCCTRQDSICSVLLSFVVRL